MRTAWALFQRHWAAFLLAQLAIAAAWLVLELAVVTAHGSGLPAAIYWPVWVCLHLAFIWVFCGLMAGIHAMALRAVDGGVPSFAIAASHIDRGTTYLLTALLYWTAVLAGLCLALIPGVVAAVQWSPFRFVLDDPARTVRSSLREARLLTASRRWLAFRVLATSTVLNLAGAALLGVGLLVAFPLTILYRAIHFRALQHGLAARPQTVRAP